MKSYLFFCIFYFGLFFSFTNADVPEQPPKKWPCDQVYNPKLNFNQFGRVQVLMTLQKIGGNMMML